MLPLDTAPAAPAPVDPSTPALSLLDTLPFPVAYPLHHAQDPSLSASDRLANTIFVAYQAMRLTALLLLADYLACDTISRELASPIRGLRMPHWQEWSVLADKLAKFWSGHFPEARPNRKSHFPELVAGWLQVNRTAPPKRSDPWADALAGLRGNNASATRATSANDAIWKLRNDRAHRQATRVADQTEDAAELTRFLPLVERMVARLFPPGGPRLVRCVSQEPLQVIGLHGAHIDLLFTPEPLAAEWAPTFGLTGVAALVGDVALPIYPLFVPGDEEPEACRVGSGGLIERISMVDGVKEKRLVLLGVRSHGESERHIGPLLEALARKNVDTGQDREGTKRWTIAGWSRTTARETLAGLRNGKYFPECYVERRRVDDVVLRCTAEGGRGLLVLGEAGAGKSSLLARLADRLSAEPSDQSEDSESGDSEGPREQPAKKDEKVQPAMDRYLHAKGEGDVVLFLSGHAAFAGDSHKDGAALLADAVMQRAGVCAGTFATLAEFADRLAQSSKDDDHAARRVWLILDALNEAPRFTDLLIALDSFLPSLGKHPWLRLVVSLRSGAYHALSSRKLRASEFGEGVITNAAFLHSFQQEFGAKDGGKHVPYLDLPAFDEHDEGPRAYLLRQSARPDRASSALYANLAPGVRRLILSPLHLHLFHETFIGDRPVPVAMEEGVLLDAYLDRLCTDLGGLRSTLADIGRLMFERRAPLLPLDVADEWLKHWRASQESVGRVTKLDPIEELVAASVLMRPAEEGVGVDRRVVAFTFSHQKLCECVLLRELDRQIAPRRLPNWEELLVWAERSVGPGDEFTELSGALETVATRIVEAGVADVLPALLDLESDRVRTRVLGAGIRALGPRWGLTEAGAAGPAGVLGAMCERALQPGASGERFNDSVWKAGGWLKTSGFSRAGAALDRSRLQIMRRLVAAEPHRADLQSDLSRVLNNLGILSVGAGRSDDARRYYDESLDVRRRLVQQEPHRADLQMDLANSYWSQYLLVSDREDELEFLRLVIATLKPLRERGYQKKQVVRLWELATKALG